MTAKEKVLAQVPGAFAFKAVNQRWSIWVSDGISEYTGKKLSRDCLTETRAWHDAWRIIK